MNQLLSRILAAALSFVMILGLCACGSKESNSGGGAGKSGDAQGAQQSTTQNAQPAGYTWKSEFKTIQTDGDLYVQPLLFTDDGFYATSQVLLGRREPIAGEVEEYEGQFDIYGPSLYFVNADGTIRPLPNYKPSMPLDNAEGKKDFYAACEISNLVPTGDGKFLAVELHEAGWYDGPDELYGSEDEDVDLDEYYVSDMYYELVTLDTDGTELGRARADLDLSNSWVDTKQMTGDGKGNLITVVDESLLAFAPDGSVAWSVDAEDYITALTTLPDGSPAILLYGETGMELRPFDVETKKLGEPYAVPDDIWDMTPGDENHEIFYTSGLYLYGVKLGEEKPERILEWMSCDISSDAVDNHNFHIEKDGRITGVIYDYSEENVQTQIFTLTRVPVESVPVKRVLTVAQLDYYPDDRLTNLMVRFNRSHDSVRLEYADYSQYNTEDDDTVGTTKFNTEVMAGQLPDILPTGQIPYRQIAARGMLEDLYPYLDADPELSREDFFPNLLSALEIGGGLYQMVPGFSVETLSGAASIVGDTPGWNYDEFNAALAKMPEGCTALDPSVTRDEVLSALLSADMNSFVDWGTGKVSFDSDSFKQLLEFVMQFPADYVPEESEDGFVTQSQDLIRQGQQMLTRVDLYGLDSMLWNDLNFGGKATMIGWPTNSGVGNIMRIDSGYAISKSCADKAAAWEFIRSMLTASAQANSYVIPSNRHAFEKQLKEYMTPIYQKDAKGNYVLDENGNKIEESRGGWVDENGEHNIYAMTQEQADEILGIIGSCTKIANFDSSIYDIVNEQAQAYFAGQKSVDEVARLIQSKANILINEQR